MSNTKKTPPAKKAPATQKISPAQEKTSQNEPKTPSSGVSPFGVVFLCLLTIAALLSGAFAFRDKLIPYLHSYLSISQQQPLALTPPPGFVPIPALKDTPTLNGITPELEAMSAKQAELAEQLEQLTSQMAERPIAPANTGENTQALSKALTKAQQSFETSLQKITILENRLFELEGLNSTLARKVEKVKSPTNLQAMLSFQTLQSQALSSQPFQDSLQRVIALLADSTPIEPTLKNLEEVAPLGRPSLAYLQKTFADSVTQALQQTAPQNESFMSKVKQNLSSIIRVRRVDGEGNEQDIILAQAEKYLAQGKVKAAYAEILKLDEAQKAAFSTWLPHAKAYYQLPEWLTQLQLHMTDAKDA